MKAAITFRQVGVSYPRAFKRQGLFRRAELFWALKDISFEIAHGDVLGIIGNNGAGKSTTLSLIAGIIGPTRGTVTTYGNKSTLLSINAGFLPALTGRKNILLLGLALGIRKSKIRETMDEIIAFSELGEFIDEPVETYSSGMKARLGFSTALMLEPDILLIDEIFGVGDRNFKQKSSDAIQKKLFGKSTAVLVSHSESTIKNVTNKVLWIERGEVMGFGPPQEVFREYIAYCDRLKAPTNSNVSSQAPSK